MADAAYRRGVWGGGPSQARAASRSHERVARGTTTSTVTAHSAGNTARPPFTASGLQKPAAGHQLDVALTATRTLTTTVNGRESTTEHDLATSTITSTSPEGRIAQLTHDALGRPVLVESAGRAAVSLVYDTHGRVESVVQSDGLTTRSSTLGYSPQSGYLTSSTQNQELESASFVHDAVGRVLSSTSPAGTETGFGYDAIGNMDELTPPERPTHAMGYSAADQLDRYTPPPPVAGSPALPPDQWTYTLHRKPLVHTLPDGRTVEYDWVSVPETGKLRGRTTSEAELRYVYSETTGQLTHITPQVRGIGSNPEDVALSYGYDGSLPKTETWQGAVTGSVTRTYDDNFWVTALSVNGAEVVSYDRDDDGLLTGAGPMTVDRDLASGDITGTTLGVITTSEDINAFGELDGYAALNGSTGLFSELVTERDGYGRIVERVETVQGVETTWRYGYDGDGRLELVRRNGFVRSTYDYDDNGNRLNAVLGGVGHAGEYDDHDRLTSYHARDYVYGDNGDLQSMTDATFGSETTDYDYDEVGNLRAVSLPDGRVVEYEIDARDRRVGKTIDGVVQWRLLYQDQLEPIAMLDAAGAVTAVFVYGTRGHVPDYVIKNGTVYRVVSDHLGSVRMVVEVGSGIVVQRVEYDEFGNVLADTNPGFTPFGFAGGIYDADTGLTRFGARDYDAVTGRWTAKDPILFGGGDAN